MRKRRLIPGKMRKRVLIPGRDQPKQLQMQQEPLPLAVSVIEAARLIGISRGMLYAMMRNKTVPTVKIGRRRLLARADIERFIEAASGKAYTN